MGTDWERDEKRAEHEPNPAIQSRVPADHASMEGSLAAGAITAGLIGAVGGGVLGAIIGGLAGAAVGAGAERLLHSTLHDRGDRGQDIYNDGFPRDDDHSARMQQPTDWQPDEFVDSSTLNQPGDHRPPPVGTDTRRT